MIIETIDTCKEQQSALSVIAQWTQASRTMLPLTPENMKTHPFGAIALDHDTVLGYSAITTVYQPAVAEFGGLIVHPGARRQGIAAELTRFTVQNYLAHAKVTEQVIVFANQESSPLFQKLGGVILGEKDRLIEMPWQLNAAEPPKPTRSPDIRSCNTVIDLTRVA